MKPIKSFAVLGGVAVIAIFAADGSAYYHPRLGRFLQRDPGGYVDGMNLYEYVSGAPITWVDPSGNQGMEVRPLQGLETFTEKVTLHTTTRCFHIYLEFQGQPYDQNKGKTVAWKLTFMT